MFASQFVMTERLSEQKPVMTGQETEKDATRHAMEMSLDGIVQEEALTLHQLVILSAVMATELPEKDAMTQPNLMELDVKLIAQDPCWGTTVQEEGL